MRVVAIIMKMDIVEKEMLLNGLNKTSLAIKSGLSYPLILNVFGDKTKITPKTAKAISTALNKSISDLFVVKKN